MKTFLQIVVSSLLLLAMTGCGIFGGSAEAEPAADQLTVPEAPAQETSQQVPAQQGGAVLKFQPDTVSLNQGETVTIELVVENVDTLAAADVNVTFDPAVLQAQDADDGKDGLQLQDGGFLQPDFVQDNSIDNGTGVAKYVVLQLNRDPASGTGTLASITFQAIADGASTLTFSKAQLPDADSQPINLTLQEATVSIGQVAAPTATPVAEQPTETPVVEQPTETPVVDQPTATPVAEQPTETPVVKQPTETPVADQPTATPVAEQPTPTFTPVVINPPSTPVVQPTMPAVYVPLNSHIPHGATIGFCYRVQDGDTLFGIGQRYGSTAANINVANALWPPDMIYVHQALFVPTHMGSGPNYYVVEQGKTLHAIGRDCHLPVEHIARVNGIPADALLYAGHVLRIPLPPFPPPSQQPYHK